MNWGGKSGESEISTPKFFKDNFGKVFNNLEELSKYWADTIKRSMPSILSKLSLISRNPLTNNS